MHASRIAGQNSGYERQCVCTRFIAHLGGTREDCALITNYCRNSLPHTFEIAMMDAAFVKYKHRRLSPEPRRGDIRQTTTNCILAAKAI